MDNNEKAWIRVEKKVDALTLELADHKERHAMVFDMFMTVGKLFMGIATFFTIVGGAIFGFYKLVKFGG